MTDDRQPATAMHPCPLYCGKTRPSKLVADECCDPTWDNLLDRGRE